MADPLTIMAIGTAVLGGVASGNAAQAQANAQAAQLQAQAQAADYNAQIAEQNIEISKGQTQEQIAAADRERRLRLGANIAASGASGISGGSSLDILQNNAAQEELNLLTIQREGLLQQRSFRNTATLDRASGQAASSQIGSVKRAGRASAAASVLGGVSSGLGVASRMSG